MAKGQLISKADCRAIDSPKKRTDKFNLFAVKSKKANSSVRFLGESMARQSAFKINRPLAYEITLYGARVNCIIHTILFLPIISVMPEGEKLWGCQ